MKLRAAAAIAVVLAAVSCRAKDKKNEKPAAPPAVVTVDAAPARPPADAAPVATGVTGAGLAKLLPHTFGLPIGFEGLRIDGTAPLPPAVDAAWSSDGEWQRSPDYPGAAIWIMRNEENNVTELGVVLPGAVARALLTRMWGEPTVGRAFLGESTHVEHVAWFDPAAHLRAWITDKNNHTPSLVFQTYLPSAELLRGLHDLAPLLGKPVAAAMAIPGTRWDDTLWFAQTPPVEWDEFDASGYIFKGEDIIEKPEDIIESIYVRVPYGSPAHRDELLALLKTIWGEPDGTVYGTGPYLLRDETPESMTLDLSLSATDPRATDERP